MRALALASALSAWALPAHAQWPSPAVNLPVCAMVGNQLYRTAISDNAGGMFVAWSDARFVVTDIYVQHVLVDGTLAWRTNGYPVCAAAARQEQPVLAADHAGGVYVVWRDFRSDPEGDIYAQHVDASGTPTWTYNGVPVCAAGGEQVSPVVVPDDAYGADSGLVVAWEDYRAGVQVYVQRIDSSGVALWESGGVPASTSQAAQFEPSMATDGLGGVYLAWSQQQGGEYDIVSQHVGSNGEPMWSAAGVTLCGAPGNQYRPLAVADHGNGAWFVWEDARGPAIQVYSQRVEYSSNIVFATDGLPVSPGAGDQTSPSASSDWTGYLVVAWNDARAGSGIYAERLDLFGSGTWGANGLAVCTGPGTHMFPSIAGDGTGGAIVSWEDARGSTGVDVYAQRITWDAQPMWAVDGQAISAVAGNQYQVTVVSSGDTAGVIVWADTRGGNIDLYAQRVPLDGVSVPRSAAARQLSVAPNPAHGQAAFAFELKAAGTAEIAIFDTAGRRIRTLANAAFDSGDHRVAWDARDDQGRRCAMGVYFARLSQDGHTLATRTIALQQ